MPRPLPLTACLLLLTAQLARAQDAPLVVPAASELEHLLMHAAQHAPAMLAARARFARADAADVEARLILSEDPELYGQFGRRRNAEGRDLELQIVLQQRVEIAGQRRVRRDVAARLRERVEAELQASWAEVRWSVERLYELARVARAQLDFAETVARFQQRMVEVAERRRALGDVGAREGHLARAEL
ncbi:MAG: TolC family protein, partial [Myxococcales bacterium]|nr:TolC family protein [Myxococcales bacterium]